MKAIKASEIANSNDILLVCSEDELALLVSAMVFRISFKDEFPLGDYSEKLCNMCVQFLKKQTARSLFSAGELPPLVAALGSRVHHE